MPRSADQGGERDQGAVYPSIGQGDVSLAAAFSCAISPVHVVSGPMPTGAGGL